MSQLVMAFDSTQQALRAEMLLEYADIDIDICPTPKSITAGCALSIAFYREDYATVQQIVVQERVEIRGVFELDGDGQYRAISEGESQT